MNRVSPLYAALLLSLTACVTHSAAQPPLSHGDLTGVATQKAGSKSDAPAPTNSSPGAVGISPAPAATSTVTRVYTPDELSAFVKKQSSPDAPFGPAEHELVGTLAKAPRPGSVDEAALAIGLVKSVLNPLGKEQQTFIESDIDKAPGARMVPAGAEGLTLESLAKERDINLADALTENPMLQGYGIAKAFFAAVSKAGNSPGFKTEILTALKNQANNWQMLSQSLNAPGTGESLPPQPEAAASTLPAPAAAATDLLPPDPAELHSSDSALSEAQALADRGDFKAAIKKAQAVDKASPLYNSAQEKVKEFSNRAVQDLRKKAAQAFQSAMPLNDKKTRAQYLQQAKSYLEDALNNYPQAAQLPTVRDNLRVISKDLEQSQSY